MKCCRVHSLFPTRHVNNELVIAKRVGWGKPMFVTLLSCRYMTYHIIQNQSRVIDRGYLGAQRFACSNLTQLHVVSVLGCVNT